MKSLYESAEHKAVNRIRERDKTAARLGQITGDQAVRILTDTLTQGERRERRDRAGLHLDARFFSLPIMEKKLEKLRNTISTRGLSVGADLSLSLIFDEDPEDYPTQDESERPGEITRDMAYKTRNIQIRHAFEKYSSGHIVTDKNGQQYKVLWDMGRKQFKIQPYGTNKYKPEK